MINIHEVFLRLDDARSFLNYTMRRYHPCGYGTSLTIRKQRDGTWCVVGYRFSSCD